MMQIFEANRKKSTVTGTLPAWAASVLTIRPPPGLTTFFVWCKGGTSPHLTKYFLYYTPLPPLPSPFHTHITAFGRSILQRLQQMEIAKKCKMRKKNLHHCYILSPTRNTSKVVQMRTRSLHLSGPISMAVEVTRTTTLTSWTATL